MYFRLFPGGPVNRPSTTTQRSWQNDLSPEQCKQREDIVLQWIRAAKAKAEKAAMEVEGGGEEEKYGEQQD